MVNFFIVVQPLLITQDWATGEPNGPGYQNCIMLTDKVQCGMIISVEIHIATSVRRKRN